MNPPTIELVAVDDPATREAARRLIDEYLRWIASGIGLGLIPARFLASHPKRRRLERIPRSGISIEASIVFMQANHLGRLEAAATFLKEEFKTHFAERPVR